MPPNAAELPSTELRAPADRALDAMSSIELLTAMNREDRRAVDAVTTALPQVAELVEAAVPRVRGGGSVHYFGAGTSGRLAFLDAAELQPTFHLEPGVVVGHIAGGRDALERSVEDAEDDAAQGVADAAAIGPGDVAIGVAASGRTPYVGGALRAAREQGGYTALVSCAAKSEFAPLCETVVIADTGPELLTGSTRLKAGTAQKLILNAFSTALMVALGRTWSNLMVSVVATNDKLRERTVRILSEALSVPAAEARERLALAKGDLRVALVAGLTGVSVDDARDALGRHGESVPAATRSLQPPASAAR